ncbi:MAG TPA: metal-dependent hydrolase [Gemmatimonadaceae bacterium]|nr:metal-dependent hydrolase [Gemmatimonadaceae bacterium]
MYIGHVGVALAAKRMRVGIGLLALLIATYTPDWIDAAVCLAGGYGPREMLSHSIPAVVIFALAGFVAYLFVTRDRVGALIIAAVILSHMFLDWITGIKPTWPGGPLIGLQLYSHPIADFFAEGVVIVAGAMVYARTLPPRRRPWLDLTIMLGALLALQLTIDVAHLVFKSLPKC